MTYASPASYYQRDEGLRLRRYSGDRAHRVGLRRESPRQRSDRFDARATAKAGRAPARLDCPTCRKTTATDAIPTAAAAGSAELRAWPRLSPGRLIRREPRLAAVDGLSLPCPGLTAHTAHGTPPSTGQPSPFPGVLDGTNSRAGEAPRGEARPGLGLASTANRYISTNDRGTRSEARAQAALMQASISSVSNVLRMSNGSIHHWLSMSRSIVLSSNR